MNVREKKELLNTLSPRELRWLAKEIDVRCCELMYKLRTAIPTSLQIYEKFDRILHPLIKEGSVNVTIAANIGSGLPKTEINRRIASVREKLQPLVAAWKPFGVKLDAVCYANQENGSIVAIFKQG